MKEHQKQQRSLADESRAEATARERGPYDNFCVQQLKNLIFERSGKRIRFSDRNQLVDIPFDMNRLSAGPIVEINVDYDRKSQIANDRKISQSK